MKPILIKLLSLFSQFGIDPLRLIKAIQGIPAYLRDLRTFRRHYQGPLQLMPCLHDRYEEGGITRSEYFWQDLLVARWIYEANPRKHVDVGSRVDGFVAHVASFRELEVLDLRPITTAIPGVSFRQADLMSPDSIAGLTVGGVLRLALLPECVGALRSGPLRRSGGCGRLSARPGPSGGVAATAG